MTTAVLLLNADPDPMKTCRVCMRDLPLSDYTRNKRSADGLRYDCKGCVKAYAATYYVGNKADFYRRSRESTLRGAAVAKDYIDGIKAVPCADCSNSFPPVAMDFDHVRGDKKFNVSQAATKRVSRALLDAEIAKCDIICACCHRIRTFNRLHGVS